MSKLLINEPPIQVLPSLAVKIGLSEAIVLQQLHYWLNNPNAGKVVNGKKWIYATYNKWQKDNFPFWSTSTIKRTFLNLETEKYVLTAQFDKGNYDRQKYYRINYDKLEEINKTVDDESSNRREQIEPVDDTKFVLSTLTETTTENMFENQKESKNPDTEEEKKPETFEDFGFYSNPVESLVSMKEFDADGNQIAPETVYKDRLAKVVDKSLFAPHTKRDVSRFPEEVQALAQIFIDKTSILPAKSEMSHWIEHLRNMLQMGVTSDILGGAVDRAFRDNMCVKSPASVKYALTDLLKGGGRGAKTVYEAASQVFE